jgi:hypothetical protein
MDITKIAGFALFIPFIIVFGICCLLFLKTGYKKGLWRSLISLGASVASFIVSMLLGRLLGWLLAGPIAGIVPVGQGATGVLTRAVVQGAIQAVLALIFFAIFFLIAVIVAKKLSKKIHFEKMDKEPQDKKGYRYAGLGIRTVDAIIVSLALLLPLYGSLSIVAPPAATISKMSAGGGSSTAASLLEAVSDHPLVEVYKGGPAGLMVQSVATVNVGGESLDPTEIMQALEGTAYRFAKFQNADGEQRAAALADLVRYMQNNVVNKDWSYDIMRAGRQLMGFYLEQESDPVGQQMYELLNMSRQEFKSNGMELLGFVDYALSNNFMTFYKHSDYETLSPEFYEKLGGLVNHSKQAIAFKKTLMKEAAAELFGDAQQADAFIEQYITDEPIAKELQKQEGEAFMRIMFETYGKIDRVEAFARHPNIGYAGAKDLLTETVLVEELGYRNEYGQTLDNRARIQAVLQAKLATYETAPMTNIAFKNYAQAVVSIDRVISGQEDWGFYATDALLEELLRDLPAEYFTGSAGQKVKALLQQALTEAKQNPGKRGDVNLYRAYIGESDQVFNLWDVYDGYASSGTAYAGDGGMLAIQPDANVAGLVMQTNPDGTVTIIQGLTP